MKSFEYAESANLAKYTDTIFHEAGLPWCIVIMTPTNQRQYVSPVALA